MNFIAHRALDNHSYGENTKEAVFEVLDKTYIKGVELDIRLTKDHKFVVHHNSSYRYLGIRQFIKNTTYQNVVNDNLGTKDKPRYISGLEDILKEIKTDKLIVLDIKTSDDEEEFVIKEIKKILNKYRYLNIFLCSFNYNIVNKMAKYGKYNVGLIVSDILNKNKNIDVFNFLSLSKNAFHDIKTDKIKMAWTINTREDLAKVKGANYIITDKAYLLE